MGRAGAAVRSDQAQVYIKLHNAAEVEDRDHESHKAAWLVTGAYVSLHLHRYRQVPCRSSSVAALPDEEHAVSKCLENLEQTPEHFVVSMNNIQEH